MLSIFAKYEESGYEYTMPFDDLVKDVLTLEQIEKVKIAVLGAIQKK